MLKIGLTGSIGSGKTTIAAVFRALGVPVYMADLQARELMNTEKVWYKIKEAFGDEIMLDDNQVNRKALAEIVFNSKESLKRLNDIIHPEVKNHFEKWLQNCPEYPYIIHEAAILFESGFSKYFDKIIVVTAPVALRVKRVINRDHVTEESIIKRMSFQWDDEKKKSLSQYVLYNDEKELLIPQILKIHKQFLEYVAG